MRVGEHDESLLRQQAESKRDYLQLRPLRLQRPGQGRRKLEVPRDGPEERSGEAREHINHNRVQRRARSKFSIGLTIA